MPTKMDLFDVEVKLGDRETDMLVHAAPRVDVTEMEIKLLRGIHGHGAIKNIRKTHSVERDEEEEVHRLCMFYRPGVVAKILQKDVQGWENYADKQRQATDAELEQRQRERTENQARAKAKDTAVAVAAVLNEAGVTQQKQPEKRSREQEVA